MPGRRPPSAFRWGHLLGGECSTVPPRSVTGVLSAFLRRGCTAGGAVGGFAASGVSPPRRSPVAKHSRHSSTRYWSRDVNTHVRRYGSCNAGRRRTPRPHAGDVNAVAGSVFGHGTFKQRHRWAGGSNMRNLLCGPAPHRPFTNVGINIQLQTGSLAAHPMAPIVHSGRLH